jgi:outer membrane protein TolC
MREKERLRRNRPISYGWWKTALVGLAGVFGCAAHSSDRGIADPCNTACLTPECSVPTLKVESPCLDECTSDEALLEKFAPQDLNLDQLTYTSLSLEQCMNLALSHSRVMRDLGGTILRSPQAVNATHDAAITYTDPRFGEEAALSAFDTKFFAGAVFNKNDRVLNNRFFGQDGVVQQDLGDYRAGFTKTAATGAQFTLRQLAEYDFNNQLGNRYGTPSGTWGLLSEAEWRQPLLQGSGVMFNRIAGPLAKPGEINGVLIARTRADIQLADFERGVRDLLSDVENAYWDLYYAYRDLESTIEARDQALETWRLVKAKADGGEAGSSQEGTADKESQAREQFHRFETDVIRALSGRLVDGTRTFNGSSAGTFRGGGVRVVERRLRLLLGLPINGTDLLRPSDVPTKAHVSFDWEITAQEGLTRRPELRKQRWTIKQRELELLASKNFLLPRLDLFARYRMRGFGQELAGADGRFTQTTANPDALSDLFTGDLQEWQMGFDLNVPIGYRQQHMAVRNAELRLSREWAILSEQKREVMFGLSNAVGEVDAAYQSMLSIYNRLVAAQDQVDAVTVNYQRDAAPLDLVLDAQRRLVEAKNQFYQAQVEYTLAIKNVHFEKGTLLEFYQVLMSESASQPGAREEVSRTQSQRRSISYARAAPRLTQ